MAAFEFFYLVCQVLIGSVSCKKEGPNKCLWKHLRFRSVKCVSWSGCWLFSYFKTNEGKIFIFIFFGTIGTILVTLKMEYHWSWCHWGMHTQPHKQHWYIWRDMIRWSLWFSFFYFCVFFVSKGNLFFPLDSTNLTLVLLNPDIPCLCKQCRSRSVGFWRSQLIWICTVCH